MAPLSPFFWQIHFSLPDHLDNGLYKSRYKLTKEHTLNLVEYSERGSNEIIQNNSLENIKNETELDELIFTKYMDERPGSQGLFSQEGPVDVKIILNEIKEHNGILWYGLVSLNEDEAKRINHLSSQDWQHSFQRSFPNIADIMNIPESNFRWIAAFHNKKGNPHCHYIFWENKPERNIGEISEGEMIKIEKTLIRNIYDKDSERNRLYLEKTFYRYSLGIGVRDILGLKVQLNEKQENIREEIGAKSTIAPKLTPEQKQYLNHEQQILSKMLPGHGRIAFKFMPREVKEKAEEISNWALQQPGFKEEVEKYLQAHLEISQVHTNQNHQLTQAKENAYEDLIKRMAQNFLEAAREVQNFDKDIEVQEQIYLDEDFYDSNETVPDIPTENSVGFSARSKPEREAFEWYRSTYRYLQRENEIEYGPVIQISKSVGKEAIKQLESLIIPEGEIGRPPLEMLPPELREQARNAAEWMLSHIHKEIVSDSYEAIRDWVAEAAVAHAIQLQPREKLEFEMHIHWGRAEVLLEKVKTAAVEIIKDDIDEAKWTAGKMYEVLEKTQVPPEEIVEIVTRWANEAGLTDEQVKIIMESPLDEKYIGKDEWNRMRDNLGLPEDELKNPFLWKVNRVIDKQPNLIWKERNAAEQVYKTSANALAGQARSWTYEIREQTIKDLKELVIPKEVVGKPAFILVPFQLQEMARKKAKWLLSQVGGEINVEQPEIICDKIAEQMIHQAIRLQPRVVPEMNMLLHPERVNQTLKVISTATPEIVKDDVDEKWWTVNKMYESLEKMGIETKECQNIVRKWAEKAGYQEKTINYILSEPISNENPYVSQAEWRRLQHNLGLQEYEMMNPWMGYLKQSKEDPTIKDIPVPLFSPEKVPGVILAIERATGGALLEFKELKWTVYTTAWSLGEMGVSYTEINRLINNWVDRAGIDISAARLKDMIDRATLKNSDDTPGGLGKKNWERLFSNLDVGKIPQSPWQYQSFNLVGAMGQGLWQGLWLSLQMERSKSEYQARLLENEREQEERDRKRREGRSR